MDIKKQRLLDAVKSGKVMDAHTLALHQVFSDVQDEVDKIEKAKEAVDETAKTLEKKVTPTDEKLLALIKPLIPEVEDGHTPTSEELLALIKPLIPVVKDGKTWKKAELLAIIRPLIPMVSEIAAEAAVMTENRLTPFIPTMETMAGELPKLGHKMRDGLEALTEDDRLDLSAIRGITVSPTAPENPKVGDIWLEI